MQNLNGKRVVVTGGSQGLGLAMVEALTARGANVTAATSVRDREICGGRAGWCRGDCRRRNRRHAYEPCR